MEESCTSRERVPVTLLLIPAVLDSREEVVGTPMLWSGLDVAGGKSECVRLAKTGAVDSTREGAPTTTEMDADRVAEREKDIVPSAADAVDCPGGANEMRLDAAVCVLNALSAGTEDSTSTLALGTAPLTIALTNGDALAAADWLVAGAETREIDAAPVEVPESVVVADAEDVRRISIWVEDPTGGRDWRREAGSSKEDCSCE